MKIALCVAVSALCLAGCNKGPSVDLKNATGNQVVQAVKQSGVMSGDASMIQPGLWQSKVTVREMNMPGMPPQYAKGMKLGMEDRTSSHCVKPEDVKKPKEDFFGAHDNSCKYAHFAMGGGKMDVQMVCKEEGTTRTSTMTGTYTPTSYSMDVSSTGTGGHEGDMSMKMHVDANRVGECTGKE